MKVITPGLFSFTADVLVITNWGMDAEGANVPLNGPQSVPHILPAILAYIAASKGVTVGAELPDAALTFDAERAVAVAIANARRTTT